MLPNLHVSFIVVVVILVASPVGLATEQEPDVLLYQGNELALDIGWGHPSPLEVYYHKNRLRPPFSVISTANYRGHIAIWKIVEGRLFLRKVLAPGPADSSDAGFDHKMMKFHPRKFGIQCSGDATPSDHGVLADWFDGVVLGYSLNEEEFQSHCFQIRSGRIVETGPAVEPLYERYVQFHYQLDSDEIILGSESCRLQANASRPSPIFAYFGESFLDWPYSWENRERSGAPRVKWSLIDNVLYLEGVELLVDSHMFEPETEEISLKTLFGDNEKMRRVTAVWVDGVFLIMHGKGEQMDHGEYTSSEFHISGYSFISIKDGEVKALVKVPKSFFSNPESLDGKNQVADLEVLELYQEWAFPEIGSNEPTGDNKTLDPNSPHDEEANSEESSVD